MRYFDYCVSFSFKIIAHFKINVRKIQTVLKKNSATKYQNFKILKFKIIEFKIQNLKNFKV